MGSTTLEITKFVKDASLHEIENLAGVLAVICALNLDIAEALQGLRLLSTPKRRGNIVDVIVDKVGLITLVDSTYNANPLSMKAALQSMKTKAGRKVAILADMLELGNSSPACHKSLLANLQESDIDKTITVGTEMQNLWEVLPEQLKAKTFANINELLNEDPSMYLKEGDIVLVKGSNGMHLEKWFKMYTDYTC